jgi:2-dehydropantoate 2-reductase
MDLARAEGAPDSELPMRVLVYGAGAVGGFFGGLLANAGVDVHFVARGVQLGAMRTLGLTIDSQTLGKIVVPRLSVFASARDAGIADLILVCVKTHQLPEVFDDLAAAVAERTIIVPLQNGVEADEQLRVRFPHSTVLAAVVYVGATVQEPAVISHVAAGKIGIGAIRQEDAAALPAVEDVLSKTGQPIHISDDIQRERWHKLIWNAAFNPVSAITGRGPVDLVRQEPTRTLILRIMGEVLAVGQACGVNLRPGDIDEQIGWTERSVGLKTSTMVDRERGRTMEIEGLIGVVVRKGREAGVPTPCSEVIYTLLKTIDSEQSP